MGIYIHTHNAITCLTSLGESRLNNNKILEGNEEIIKF